MKTLDAFTRAFFEAALFSSTDESRDDGGDPLDENYTIEDIDPTCLETLAAECARFQEENASDLEARDASRGGHDFWMTRAGHGCGFWDGDWPDAIGQRLTADCERYGEVSLYLGDNGTIYAFGYEEVKAPSPELTQARAWLREKLPKRLGGGS